MKAVEFTVLNLLFPVVLGIHNLEEYARCEDFLRTYQGRLIRRFMTCRVMRNAVVLLTGTGAVIAILTYVYETWLLITISKTAILAMVSNAILHCVLSFKRRALTAGTLSALILVLPYGTAVAILLVHQGESVLFLTRLAIVGSMAAPIVVSAFLGMGYALSRVKCFAK